MRILIVKLSSIGDVVHTLASLNAIKKALPNAKVDWIVEDAASEVLRGSDLIEKLFVVKNRGWVGTFNDNRAVSDELKTRNYDIVIDFQGLMKSALWVLSSGAKRKIGFSNYRELSSFFLNEKLPAYDKDRHAVDRYLDLARYVIEGEGKSLGKVDFAFPINNKARKNVDNLLEGLGLDDKKFFVVAPVARWDTKMWSSDRFVEVISAVTEKYNLQALIAGGELDFEYCEDIKNKVGVSASNICTKTSLKDFAELAGRSVMALTVDSGPMHIAAAMDTPTVAIFGATSPDRTGPYGDSNIVLRSGVDCSPCMSRHCKYEKSSDDMKCMDEVTVETVVEAVSSVIESNK